MYVMLVTNNDATLGKTDEKSVNSSTISTNILGALKAIGPDTFDVDGDVEFNYVTNRIIGNHVVFLVQIPTIEVDTLALMVDAGKFAEAETEDFLDDLLNSKNASNVLESLPVSLTRTYNGEIMQNIGGNIDGAITAGLLRGPTGDDVYLMFYPGVSGAIYQQFTTQESLDNWAITRGCKIEETTDEQVE